ncbi:lipoyl synthase [Persicimonas caeni]|uniref:Lipoyl synthase n=1 Tax=Persicimonas caeni TaxID=2292766 RepID=A0A4Y6PPY0_PERCE|nr:lipoyl synthase [Persicimonas caeni]QDG50057.1 lipoyl synthase [Persicimonas caeni]QED31278.1 lipoyl synthase [Persicimonas caeni]
MGKKISLPVVNESREPTGADRISGPARPQYQNLPNEAGPRPRWIRKRVSMNEKFFETKKLVNDSALHTVCESAACPNIGECWSRKALTFMILGNVCTRSCGFCDVQTGKPLAVDEDEPRRVAEALSTLDLNYIVITSVDRDDLPDGGAGIWAETIRRTKEVCPDLGIEVLTPDFKGNLDDVDIVLDAKPDCFAHNIETVAEMHRVVRPQAKYERSLAVLAHSAKRDDVLTKSGMMLGLGETKEQTLATMQDLADAGVQILNLGQYLRPSPRHLPIKRWVSPEEFDELAKAGEEMGFEHVEAGPLVRSSYRADLQAAEIEKKRAED